MTASLLCLSVVFVSTPEQEPIDDRVEDDEGRDEAKLISAMIFSSGGDMFVWKAKLG